MMAESAVYLSGLTHRQQLFDTASRWLADRVRPDDGRVLSEIFAFERAITAPVVRRFVADLCHLASPEELYLERVGSKDDVRAAILAACPHPSPRVAELFDWYRQLPEEYFPRTPVQMSLVTRRNGTLAAMVRRKRIRRIADKVSRRVAEALEGQIERVARRLAASRPRGPAAGLYPSRGPSGEPAGMIGTAERLVADRIRSGRMVLEPDGLRVDDVIGVKLIGTPDELARVEAGLEGLPMTRAFDREVHNGSYAGTHILVELALPPAAELVASMAPVDWAFAAGRGLEPAALPAAFERFAATASRTFMVELILTTFDDLVESELGTSIHENRILSQRNLAGDFGRLATNASWIIEYMLRLAVSPTVAVDTLPIKLWGRYLRDTVADAIDRLDRVARVEWAVPTEQLEGLLQISPTPAPS